MKKRLLIVEDHDEFRATLKGFLKKQKLDFEIFESSNGEMAVAKSSCVQPHVVLIDIHLPKANGFAVSKEIKNDNPQCDIIFLTIFNVDIFKTMAKELKAKAFIPKDQVYEKLLPILQEYTAK